jgi:hypothetical protein
MEFQNSRGQPTVLISNGVKHSYSIIRFFKKEILK